MPKAVIVCAVVALASLQALGCRRRDQAQARTWPNREHAVVDMEPAPALRDGQKPSPSATGAGSTAAKTIFRERCIVCHGESGKGDGPGAAALKVKPRDYTNAEWQASVTDDFVRQIVVKGGAAVGKDPGMPANPDLTGKPEVVDGLLEIVRGFRGRL